MVLRLIRLGRREQNSCFLNANENVIFVSQGCSKFHFLRKQYSGYAVADEKAEKNRTTPSRLYDNSSRSLTAARSASPAWPADDNHTSTQRAETADLGQWATSRQVQHDSWRLHSFSDKSQNLTSMNNGERMRCTVTQFIYNLSRT